MVKNLPANAGVPGDKGFIPELGRSPGVGNGNALQYTVLAWWEQGGGVREQSRPPWGLGPEGKWYLEAELRELGSLGYRWQLQEVPTDDELDPSEWLILLPDSSGEEHRVL